MKIKYKKLLFYFSPLLIISLVLVYLASQDNTVPFNKITYYQLLQDIENNKVKSVSIQSNRIIACHSNLQCFETLKPTQPNPALLNILISHNIEVHAEPSLSFGTMIRAWWSTLLLYAVILILLTLLIIKSINYIFKKS